MYKNLIFDFDGVLADSNTIRINGFRTLFRDFPADQVETLAAYASVNGGMSRYEKIKYFFQVIRGSAVSQAEVDRYAGQYSQIVKDDVIKAAAITGSVDFLKEFAGRYVYAIVSGSDQTELREVCRQRGIHGFFKEILGSPVSKEINLENLIGAFGWQAEECLLVGDSINDYKAARQAGIRFIGRNSGMTDWSAYADVRAFDVFGELPKYLK